MHGVACGAGEGDMGQAWWVFLCILIFKPRAVTNPLKCCKQRSAVLRFLFSHQGSDDSENLDTFVFPEDFLLMEQWPLLLYSCCEFGMESGRWAEGWGSAVLALMILLYYVLLTCTFPITAVTLSLGFSLPVLSFFFFS